MEDNGYNLNEIKNYIFKISLKYSSKLAVYIVIIIIIIIIIRSRRRRRKILRTRT